MEQEIEFIPFYKYQELGEETQWDLYCKAYNKVEDLQTKLSNKEAIIEAIENEYKIMDKSISEATTCQNINEYKLHFANKVATIIETILDKEVK